MSTIIPNPGDGKPVVATTPAPRLTVTLGAAPNYDHSRRTHRGSVNVKARAVEVASLDDAAEKCIAFIDEYGLGGGNWTGGRIELDGKVIAHVSYNGRVWPGARWKSGDDSIEAPALHRTPAELLALGVR